MGKKSKHRSPAATTTPIVEHSHLPHDQRKSWILTDNLDALKEYFDLLDWIRGWGCKEGLDFGAIRSLKCVSEYPLTEVCVSTPGVSEKKFLISRASLYILAFYSPLHGWLEYQDDEVEIKFSGRHRLLERKPKYRTNPWDHVGPKAMIDALSMMDSTIMENVYKGSEIFFVHLSEASRLRLVQLTIGKTLIPISAEVSSNDDHDDSRQQKAGSQNTFDVFCLIAPIKVELTKSVRCHHTVRHSVKKFKQLCKTWYVYHLSEHKLFELDTKTADLCGVTTISTLRSSLCVLANINLDKILMEWEKKLEKNRFPPNFTKEDFRKMRSRICEIEGQETVACRSSEGHDKSLQIRERVVGSDKKKRKRGSLAG